MALDTDAAQCIREYIQWRMSNTLRLTVTKTPEGLLAKSEDGSTMVFGDDRPELLRHVRELLDDNRDIFPTIRFLHFSGFFELTADL